MKSSLEHKGAVLNLLDATLTWNSQQIELTKNELKILQTLMEHKEKIVSREEPQYIWLGIRALAFAVKIFQEYLKKDIPGLTDMRQTFHRNWTVSVPGSITKTGAYNSDTVRNGRGYQRKGWLFQGCN